VVDEKQQSMYLNFDDVRKGWTIYVAARPITVISVTFSIELLSHLIVKVCLWLSIFPQNWLLGCSG
jgi:hypothetical protein